MSSGVSKTVEAIEEKLLTFFEPIKPYLPGIARFLLVVTYIEDSIRIVSQWSDQVNYLRFTRGIPWLLVELFLIINVATMLVGSVLAIAKKHTEYAVGGLFIVMLSQAFGYGLAFDFNFFVRNLSILGGLLMLLADYYMSTKKKTLFAGIPSVSENDRTVYLQLTGRILLVFLFISFILNGEFSIARAFVSVISFIGCIMVVVGFKAKWSAWFLIAFLSLSNFALNNWWSLHHLHPHRDFLKYDFFQTLSIVGGFLLLVNLGPGGISVDEQKKSF